MTARKPVIGLTGGIGSGKSLVAKQLASLGAWVVDADGLARTMLDEPAVRQTLAQWWGEKILNDEGRVNRHAVAEVVFNDPQQRIRLEGLIHPMVAARRDDMIRQAMADSSVPAVVVDAPLLMEAGWHERCDHVIFVHADRLVRLQRLQENRGWDEAELARREKSQWPLDKKVEIADDVVDNNTSEAACLAQVKAIFNRIIDSTEFPP